MISVKNVSLIYIQFLKAIQINKKKKENPVMKMAYHMQLILILDFKTKRSYDQIWLFGYTCHAVTSILTFICCVYKPTLCLYIFNLKYKH